MATANDVDLRTWTPQSSSPIYDGLNWNQLRVLIEAGLVPITTDVRQFIWGHSLIHHTFVGESNDYTNVPIWLHALAVEAGYTYAVDGVFGFGQQHVDALPPDTNWSFTGVPSVAPLWSELTTPNWLAADINTCMFTCANFRQSASAADTANGNWSDITTQTTNTLFSFAETANPGNARYLIYENWQDMASFTTADFSTTYPTPAECDAYWASNNGTFHDWWVDYHDAMMRDYPGLNVKMIPVGYAMGVVLRGTLSSIPSVSLYEDGSPHGRPTLYFLAALVTYMGIYGAKAPKSYTVPGNIHSDVANNLSQVIDEIWDILINFNDADNNSRVFPRLMPRAGLGVNVDGIVDWNTSQVFTDMIKYSRELIPGVSGTFDTGEEITVDANGWPTVIPSGADPELFRYVSILWDLDSSFIGGQFVLTYSGSGTLSFIGATVDSQSAGRADLTLPSGGGVVTIRIEATTNGDNLRDFKLVRLEDEAVDTAANPFTQEFLDSLSIYESIRFMDWPETNNSTQVNWADRHLPTRNTYSGGVPWEIQCELLNATNKNGWFCLPHQATNDYVTQLANLVLTNLNSDLNVQVEYSNEVWNGLFQQQSYCAQQGDILWGGGATYENAINYYGVRANETIGLWKTAWGAQSSRVKGVLSAQSDNTWTFTTAYTCPLNGGGCDTNIDQVAIAPYFGNSMGTDSGRQAEFEAATLTAIFNEIDTVHIPASITAMNSYSSLATTNGLELVAYEGGSHLVWYGPSSQTIYDLFDNASRDPRMEASYTVYFNGWKAATSGSFMQFTHCSRYGQYGSWGSMEHLDQINDTPRTPKRLALEKF